MKRGRKKKPIDWPLVEKLSFLQCTQAEIASTVNVSVDTLVKYKEFSEIYKKGQDEGKKSLRRMQFESAQKGSVPMQIWLGKQYLNQTDSPDYNAEQEKIKNFFSIMINVIGEIDPNAKQQILEKIETQFGNTRLLPSPTD